MKSLLILLIMSIPVAACGSPPLGRYQDGQVRQEGELPCFSVADSEEVKRGPPELIVIEVDERLAVGTEKRWELSFGEQNRPTTLSAQQCVGYGSRPAFTKTEMLPAELKVGGRYEVSIWSALKRTDGREEGRSYRAKFCMTKDASLKTIVHQVFWDEQLHLWLWDVCGLKNAAE